MSSYDPPRASADDGCGCFGCALFLACASFAVALFIDLARWALY